MKFHLDIGSDEPNFKRPELLMAVGIPEPLWGVNPRTIRGKAWWDERRKKAYEANNFCCHACGVHRFDAAYKQHLEAHEVYETNWKEASLEFVEVVALCNACHSYVHRGRLRLLVAKGQATQKKLEEVEVHGRATLGEGLHLKYGLMLAKIPLILPGWNKWHLRFEGKKYRKTFSGEIIEGKRK